MYTSYYLHLADVQKTQFDKFKETLSRKAAREKKLEEERKQKEQMTSLRCVM